MPPAADAPSRGVSIGSRGLDGLLIAVGGGLAALLLEPAAAGLATAWLVAVVVVVRSDRARMIIPDEASAAIAALGLAQAALNAWGDGGAEMAAEAGSALAGGAVAFGLFWLLAALYRWRAGHDGLGFGDVKLAGASAIWLGAVQQTMALEIACLAALGAALLWSRGPGFRRAAVPFGAFLAPAAWLVFVMEPSLATLAGAPW